MSIRLAGNRGTSAQFCGFTTQTATYTANELNQYESITVPGEVWLTGSATSTCRVACRVDTNQGVLGSRHDTEFWCALAVDNG